MREVKNLTHHEIDQSLCTLRGSSGGICPSLYSIRLLILASNSFIKPSRDGTKVKGEVIHASELPVARR